MDKVWKSPGGKAFRRLMDDAKFAEMVRKNPKKALGGIDLPEPVRRGLISDAKALEAAGFFKGTHLDAGQLGGLKTPGALGIEEFDDGLGWNGCLTCT